MTGAGEYADRPCGKGSYPSKADADRAIRNIRRSHERYTRQTRPRRSYPCDECGLWHVTSEKEGPLRTRNSGGKVRRRADAAREVLDDILDQYDGPIPRFKM